MEQLVNSMHTYASYSKEEIQEFFDKVKPSFWRTKTSLNPETMETIYILEWHE